MLHKPNSTCIIGILGGKPCSFEESPPVFVITGTEELVHVQEVAPPAESPGEAHSRAVERPCDSLLVVDVTDPSALVQRATGSAKTQAAEAL